ncbi:MAG: hypothetical protein GY746_08815 [Gammaproteobacteria bacterium]|nr:hypothetical protein [Gammaproteobacteria bacterium]
MNNYAWAEKGTPKAYFDDIILTEMAAPGGGREIVVAPTALNYQLPANQPDTKAFTITNVGQADLEYNVSVTYSSVAAGNRMPTNVQQATGYKNSKARSSSIRATLPAILTIPTAHHTTM